MDTEPSGAQSIHAAQGDHGSIQSLNHQAEPQLSQRLRARMRSRCEYRRSEHHVRALTDRGNRFATIVRRTRDQSAATPAVNACLAAADRSPGSHERQPFPPRDSGDFREEGPALTGREFIMAEDDAASARKPIERSP